MEKMAKVKVTITLEDGRFIEADVEYNSPGGIDQAINELIQEVLKEEK